jgi:hypothetical protein
LFFYPVSIHDKNKQTGAALIRCAASRL